MTPTAYSPANPVDSRLVDRALAHVRPGSFWLDSTRDADGGVSRGSDASGLRSADLIVVGGGYTGLWTALQAKERDPSRTVVLLEAVTIAWAASGRNGGFVDASLTHGDENGERHFADDLPLLKRLGLENYAAMRDTIARYSIDAEWEDVGMLQVATEPYQIDFIRELAADNGEEFLDAEATRALVDSPLYRAGVHLREGIGLVHPVKLAHGLRRACESLGVEIHEHTRATGLRRQGGSMVVQTDAGEYTAPRVALATNGFRSLVRRADFFVVPVYDYALMTEPLSSEQLERIGWSGRQGIGDSSRQFHYYRLSADNRVLFGGYDAIYHRGGRIRNSQDQRPATFRLLADHFFRTFPQLDDVDFSHAWGGAIDMSTKLVAHISTAYGGQVAYAAGYTGLGVASTRVGAQTMLDLLDGRDTELTRLPMATKKPFPVPPEPIAYPAIQVARAAVARSDENEGRDGLLLRAMGALGISFDT